MSHDLFVSHAAVPRDVSPLHNEAITELWQPKITIQNPKKGLEFIGAKVVSTLWFVWHVFRNAAVFALIGGLVALLTVVILRAAESFGYEVVSMQALDQEFDLGLATVVFLVSYGMLGFINEFWLTPKRLVWSAFWNSAGYEEIGGQDKKGSDKFTLAPKRSSLDILRSAFSLRTRVDT